MRIETHVDLIHYNTFGLSSMAESLVHVESFQDIEDFYTTIKALPNLVLGGGSNMLLTQNIEGTVLRV